MEIATARSFILNRGIVTDTMSATDLADNSLGGVECTAHHPGSRGVADIVSVTMSLLSIKDLAVAISTRAGPAEDDPTAI